jgi:hypothetical protein
LALATRTLLALRAFRALTAILTLSALLIALGAIAALSALFAVFATAFAFATLAIRPVTVAAATTTAEAILAALGVLLMLRTLLLELAFRLLALAARGFGFAALGAFGLRRFIFSVEIRLVGEAVLLHWGRHRRLHLAQEAEIVLGVLEEIFRRHPVAGRLRVARHLQVALIDERRRPADFPLRAIALHRPVRVLMTATLVVMVMTTATARLTTAATLTLHGVSVHSAYVVSCEIPSRVQARALSAWAFRSPLDDRCRSDCVVMPLREGDLQS